MVGEIKISKSGYRRRRSLVFITSSNFFAQPITYEIKWDCIIFRPAIIDDVKQYTPTSIKNDSYYKFTVTTEYDIDPQRCDFDESSNIDEVVIYYD
jgi:hypothetical protein